MPGRSAAPLRDADAPREASSPPPVHGSPSTPALSSEDAALIGRAIGEESNRAVRRGMRYAAIFGIASAFLLWGLMSAGVLHGLVLPAALAFGGGSYALVLWSLARKQRLRRWGLLWLLPLISFPSTLFLTAHFLTRFGAVTFLNGPYAFLYIDLIVVTGFFFDPRLARWAGVIVAAEYVGCALLDRQFFALIHVADPLLQQDLTDPVVYAVRSTMMVLGGFLVGGLATTGRNLLQRVLAEAREKQSVSRLFGEYVSPEVRERILRERSGQIAERKQVVVLFSDIRGFTTYSETADPAALVEHLNAYFDGMVGAITRHGGVVDKFIGDAVMAVFGGLVALPNSAASALDAALEMRRALEKLNALASGRGWPELQTGLGMHLGEVIQGTLGSAERKEFTVVGDVVNTASRLEGITKELGASIVVSRAFVDALPPESRARCRPLGTHRLKGKQQELELFAVGE